MPTEKLLLNQVILNIAGSYQSNISAKSQAIYITVIVALLALVISLPLVTTSIHVKSSALIRPSAEVSVIRSLVNGRVKDAFIVENQTIQKGNILHVIESEMINEKEKYLQLKVLEMQNFIDDLRKLISPASVISLSTTLFQQSHFNYLHKVRDATTRYNKVKIDYARNRKLHREKVIADAEFENFQFEFDKAKNDLELLKQDQLNQWQNELRRYEIDLQDFETQLAQLQKEKENLTIKAPISGSIQNLAGIYPGSIVFVNQDLAQISPDTNLIVESFINPNDIGLLREGMPVRFQVDAFNYNQWGLATGRVIEISNDIHIVNEKPVFKVRCLLDQEYLQLKNGYKGYLKKGMTLQARFMVTERTLWQLLFDKVDDWLNPNTFREQ